MLTIATLKHQVQLFRFLGASIKKHKEKVFPVGSIAHVNCDKFTGYGIVVDRNDCYPDSVAVMLRNGNTWFYNIEYCKRVTDVASLPKWIRRMKLEFCGYKPL